MKTLASAKSRRLQVLLVGCALLIALVATLTVCFADTPANTSIFYRIVAVMLQIAKYIGILLIVWGGIQLFLAFRDDNTESKMKAIWTLIAGILLTSAGFIVPAILGDSLNSDALNNATNSVGDKF